MPPCKIANSPKKIPKVLSMEQMAEREYLKEINPLISYQTIDASPGKPRRDILHLHGSNGSYRLILSHLLLTVFTFVTTYIISFYGFALSSDFALFVPRRQVNVTDFHLSTSIDYGLARCLGSLGLPIVGVGFVLIALWRYFFVHAHLPSREHSNSLFPHKRNNFSMLCAVVGGGAVIGVVRYSNVCRMLECYMSNRFVFSNTVIRVSPFLFYLPPLLSLRFYVSRQPTLLGVVFTHFLSNRSFVLLRFNCIASALVSFVFALFLPSLGFA